MRILVTGGAGYIGSHAVRRLRALGHEPAIVDNLHRGHAATIPNGVPFLRADVRDRPALADFLREHRIEAVMHFAALAYVGESVERPLDYYEANAAGTMALLRAMADAGVERFVFSSTCATYGAPQRLPIREDEPQRPINPYGRSKLMCEQILADHGASRPAFAHACLRYFNVAGCAADGSIGEDHRPETHLIPLLLEVAAGRRPHAQILGDDYPTPDGTCIRDYIHVDDLVDAHAVVLAALRPGERRVYNCGTGTPYSVRQVIDAVRAVTGHAIPAQVAPRRPGDPPELWADPSRIAQELGWRARITAIEDIVATAWRWMREHPQGYGG